MKMDIDKKLLIVLVGILVLICMLVTVLALSLSSKPNKYGDYDLSAASITLERGPCFGFCPVYTVTVHGSGKVEVSGIRNVKEGYFTYTISKSEAQDLIKSALDLGFFDRQNTYRDDQITDLDSSTLTLKAGVETKTIYLYGFPPKVPQDLIDLATEIDEVSGVRERLGGVTVEPTEPEIPQLYL